MCALRVVGGSTVLLLFEPGRLVWDKDLSDSSNGALETLVEHPLSPKNGDADKIDG
jgi:phosphatidylserine decarboxylase